MRFKLLDIYSIYLSHWLNGGEFLRKGKLSGTSIKTDYNLISTKKSVKRVFMIQAIETENLDLSFLDLIRHRLFEECPNVNVSFNVSCTPDGINISNEKFVQHLQKAASRYETYDEVYNSQDKAAILTGKTYKMGGGVSIRLSKETLKGLRSIYKSYAYIYKYVGNGGSVAQTNMFVEAIAQTPKELNMFKDKFFNLMTQLNISAKELRGVNKEYYNTFGLAAYPKTQINKKFLPQLLMSDENVSSFSSFVSRGLVGESGILFGLDYRSKLPFMVNLFETSAAQVSVIAGKSGSGKTYAAFQLALSMAASDVYISALDIKGREWSKVATFIKHKIITFDEKHPYFVNILRIDDMHATEETANEIFNIAVNGTVTLLSLIVDLPDGDERAADLNMFLRTAVVKLYNINRVTPDNYKSFIYSKNLKYQDLMPILSDLTLCQSYTEEQKEVATLARTRCYSYLGESGIFSDAFRNEVTLSEVQNVPLVIYEFNKNNTAMADTLDVLKIFMIQFLDTKKQAYLKEKGKFMACFYEELQRCPQFGNLLEYICATVTGSRSNNVFVYLLLNSFAVLQQKRAQDIKSNITSFVVGKLEPSDIQLMRDEFKQEWLASQLEEFRKQNVLYNNCFAAHIDTGASIYETVYKVVLPDDISETFRTRDLRSDLAI